MQSGLFVLHVIPLLIPTMRTKKLLQKRLGLVVQRRSAACHAETLCTSVTGSHALTACRGAIMMHGTLPSPSNHVSRPSSETRKAMIMAMVVEDPQTHGQLKTNVSATDHVISAVYKYPSHTPF